MRIWSRAAGLAAQTPAERNRYVDFLRAVSILVVVVGHWLIATAHYVDGTLTNLDVNTNGSSALIAANRSCCSDWIFRR